MNLEDAKFEDEKFEIQQDTKSEIKRDACSTTNIKRKSSHKINLKIHLNKYLMLYHPLFVSLQLFKC